MEKAFIPDDAMIGAVLAVAEKAKELAEKSAPGAFVPGCLVYDMISQEGMSDLTAQDVEQRAILAYRIANELTAIDEPRFSVEDYADAFINAPETIDLGKLLALDEESFAVAMVWLAAYKRETYEDVPHLQGDLEFDIWG